MSLSTILLTIQSLLDNDPALHEPGVKSNPSYALYVQQKCMGFTLQQILKTGRLLEGFKEPWQTRIPNILSSYASFLLGRAEVELGTLMYGMVAARTNYGGLREMTERAKALVKEGEQNGE
jgi:hypothetical protein